MMSMGTVHDDTMQRQGYGKDKGTQRQEDVPFVPPDPAQLNPESASLGPHPPQAVPLPRARGRLFGKTRGRARQGDVAFVLPDPAQRNP